MSIITIKYSILLTKLLLGFMPHYWYPFKSVSMLVSSGLDEYLDIGR